MPLGQNTIDIYYTDTNRNRHLQCLMLQMLSEEELNVYHRYGVENKKVEYLVGRYLTKNICGYYLNKKPQDIIIKKDRHGKPYLAETSIKFNISHSYGIVACAVTIGAEIGIDIEKIGDDIIGIVKRFFAPNEVDYIFNSDLSSKIKNHEAYKLWTMKEAYMKAVGKGLSIQLDSFDLFDELDMFFYSTTIKLDYYLSVAMKSERNENIIVRINEIKNLTAN